MSSNAIARFFDPITAPLGAWSCDYYYYLTLLTFLFGVGICVWSIFAIVTGATSKDRRVGYFAGVVGLVTALLPVGLAYFQTRILYSMCTASVGKTRRA